MRLGVTVGAVIFLMLATGPSWAVLPEECPDVSVTTCYVRDQAGNQVNCCDWSEYHPCDLTETCCDAPPPDTCGCTTGHLYGRAVGTVAVNNLDGCGQVVYYIRTGWMTWYQEYDEWVCAWFNYQWVDQIIVKNRGEPPTTYDHTVHLYASPWSPPPCEYWKFETQIGSGRDYEKCCTITTY